LETIVGGVEQFYLKMTAVALVAADQTVAAHRCMGSNKEIRQHAWFFSTALSRLELFGADPQTSTTRRPVPVRADRFSHFRAGFDIRTLRRCHRVLMFHHFAELGGPTLVRSTDFTYTTDADTLASLLTMATVTSYDQDGDRRYRSASMPPVVFSYTEFKPQQQRYQPLTALGGEMPRLPLSDPNMALVDLFGDGLPDILHTGPGWLPLLAQPR